MHSVRFLQIEPTTRCNFTCGFCAGRKMPQADLSQQTFQAALSAFPDVEHIELQGEGESLMHPLIFDFIAQARAKNVRVSFITNGSYLSDENVARLLDLGIERISVSIESARADLFRKIRGGKLEKVRRGLATLLAERTRRGLDRPSVGLSITVLKSTQGELPAILALYEELGLDGGITMQPLERKADYAKIYSDEIAQETLSDQEAGTLWVKFLANPSVVALQKRRSKVPGFYDQLMADWKPASRRCPWLDAGTYVSNDGRVSPCCMIKDPAHALGQLGVDSPAQLLAARSKLAQTLARGQIPPPCQGCELARFAVLKKPSLIYWGLRGVWERLFGRLPQQPYPKQTAG